MAIRIVRLGSPRTSDEGLRIGTVRRPPRGVAKARYAEENWYDVWYPELAPAADTVKMGIHGKSDAEFDGFARKYRREMKDAPAARTIALLAAMSHHGNFSVGCYCIDEARCHRSILRELLAADGALIV